MRRLGLRTIPLLLVVLVGACTGGDGGPVASGESGPAATEAPSGIVSSTLQPPIEATALAEDACRNTDLDVLLRTWRGVRLDRSGDIQIVPVEPNFVNGGLTHATPFDYTQDVPLFLYGPGFVRPGVYERPVTLADLAPTTGALLKFPFPARDGRALTPALLPEAERSLPRLVVTVIWDSGGDDVLERWSDSWPYLESLRPNGAWFTNATVGASPSNTPI